MRARPPRIHDITTDPDDPPVFVALAKVPANRGRDLTYPHGGRRTPKLQRRAYPDIEPILVGIDPPAAFTAALAVAHHLGWEVARSDADAGEIEATATTRLFRFRDDVAIRVRPVPAGGAVVDVRSLSRIGVSDLGANARRIRRFRDHLLESIHPS